jgi:hypothetical protein
MSAASDREEAHTPSAADLDARIVLGVVSAGLAVAVLAASLLRVSYPFELEWLEGVSVDYAWRIAHGLPIYGAPDATFASDFYPPLYYLVCLPVLRLAHFGLFGARLVSLASSVASGVLTVVVLRRAGASAAACLAALGVEAAFYPVVLYWYDIARVDALQTFLLLAGTCVLARNDARPTRAQVAWGGLLLAAAVFTKQTSVFVCAGSVAYFALARDWRRAVTLALALAVWGGLGAVALWLWSPAALIDIVVMPARHNRLLAAGLEQATRLAGQMAPFLLLALLGRWVGRTRAFFAVNLAGALAAAMMTLFKVGGATNSAMPAVFLLGIAVGFGLDAVWRQARDRPVLGAALPVGLAVWMVVLFGTDVVRAVPGRADRQLADRVWQDMRAEPGPFLAYNHSFVSTALRGETYPYADRLYDWAGGYGAANFRAPDAQRYPPAFLDAIRGRRFVAIYTAGGYLGDPVPGLIEQYYRVAQVYASVSDEAPRWQRCLPRLRWVPQ